MNQDGIIAVGDEQKRIYRGLEKTLSIQGNAFKRRYQTSL